MCLQPNVVSASGRRRTWGRWWRGFDDVRGLRRWLNEEIGVIVGGVMLIFNSESKRVRNMRTARWWDETQKVAGVGEGEPKEMNRIVADKRTLLVRRDNLLRYQVSAYLVV